MWGDEINLISICILKSAQALLSAYQILHLITSHTRTLLLSPLCLSLNKALPGFLRQMLETAIIFAGSKEGCRK